MSDIARKARENYIKMNKIIIACDSFKGSLSSIEVGEAVAEGIRRADQSIVTRVVAVADGGEGTVSALVGGLDGQYVSCSVDGPLGHPVTAAYGISGDGSLAVMEMAQASGLTLIPESERNPLRTSTFGTGQMIGDALSRGCGTIIMGIGGSATNDGGMGLMCALGARFLDSEGHELPHCGASLIDIEAIDLSRMNPEAISARFLIACDVNNPLYGHDGAAYVFAPQKGADARAVERLDDGLRNYARVISRTTGRDVANMPGAGAAGGLGACFAAFFNADLKPGIELMLDAVHFDDIIDGADLIITGEGRLDSQTVHGKTPYGVLQRGLRLGIPTVAIAGAVSDSELLNEAGFRAVFSIVPGPCSLAEAMDSVTARRNVACTAEQIIRLCAASESH